MTQPTPAEQLLNLADRAERHGGLTATEAARLREGVAHHCARADTLEAVCKSNKRAYIGAVKDAMAADERAKQAEAERDALAAGVPLVCSDERHKTKVGALEAEVERLRAAAQQLLNNGAKAIGEQNWARHHAEERAEKAEAELHAARDTLERVRKLAADWAAPKYRGQRGIPHVLAADVLRAALDEHQEQQP